MSGTLTDRTIAFLVANDGIEQSELTHPWRAVCAADGRAVLVAPDRGHVQTYRHLNRMDRYPVDVTVEAADAADYDAVVLPGGVANPDILRRVPAAHRLLRQADAAGATIAAICHGPWTLIDAGLVAGRTLAAWPSLATDLTNAGATWTADRTHVDGTLITAQSDQDIDAFTALLLAAVGRSS
ncbi:DJ-1/PfpI family protein [Nocardia sp. CA-135953]|uniref:DJ-1/PfpI family protein n=1 Tax=Nocardia sp. CA-135953 TaxID=3239978 RepID=UPI003D99DCFE